MRQSKPNIKHHPENETQQSQALSYCKRQSFGFQYHSQQRQDEIFKRFKLHCQDKTFISSTMSSISLIQTFKTIVYLIFHIIHIDTCQINRKPLLRRHEKNFPHHHHHKKHNSKKHAVRHFSLSNQSLWGYGLGTFDGVGLFQMLPKNISSELLRNTFGANKPKTKLQDDLTEKLPLPSAFQNHTSSPSLGTIPSKALKRLSKISLSRAKRFLRHPKDQTQPPSNEVSQLPHHSLLLV